MRGPLVVNVPTDHHELPLPGRLEEYELVRPLVLRHLMEVLPRILGNIEFSFDANNKP